MRHPLDQLRAHRYARLTTFRASGEEVHTPVWFVMRDNAVYVETGDQTGKAKRVRRDPRVIIAPCTPWGSPRGPGIPATAKDLGSAPPARIRAALLRRYGPLQWFRDVLLRRRHVTPTFLEITAEPHGLDRS
ncbi:PPOX class F420-dependent oxidoreductase [Nonomuraea rosea]|uniref:PPOX class F420-dependent oxidoreductase n=1 Tax=Nonomuraea rosea TaxID=638574 RepID=A0ABP6ZNA8_9ACTN